MFHGKIDVRDRFYTPDKMMLASTSATCTYDNRATAEVAKAIWRSVWCEVCMP